MNFKEQLQDFQRQIILDALHRSRGVQKQAAKMLGLKPTTLNEMIKRLGVETESLS
jgi:transcriptional regulator with GAF, ATPase, and Fis domain